MTNTYLEGNFAPVTEEVTAFDHPVVGQIPSELNGRYLRIGPNPVGPTDPDRYHWFTGEGMVHGIRLGDGRAEWYRNRWVRTPALAERFGEPAVPNPYPSSVPIMSANTNVIRHAGATLACVEAGFPPIELNEELDTVRVADFGGTLEHPFSAHPKLDPTTGELHVAAYYWAWGNRIRYLVVGPDGRVTRNVDVEVTGGPMVHDIAMSRSQVALFDLPCVFDFAAASTSSFPYRWDPEYPARVAMLSRGTDTPEVQWFEVEPCYVFHPLNSFDRADGAMVIDVIRHPRMFASHLQGPDEGAPILVRWVLDPVSGRLAEEVLDDRPAEFPRINETLTGGEHRYGYAVEAVGGLAHGRTLKYDLNTATTLVRDHGPGRGGLEPVFVPRPDAAAEDDGWIIQVVYDAARDGSDLVIYDATEFTAEPVAVVELPQRVPFGFHGNWVPDL